MMGFVLKYKRKLAAVLSAAMVIALPGFSSFSALNVYAAAIEDDADEKDTGSEIIEIASADDFERTAQLCRSQDYSAGKVFVLTSDIDLTGKSGFCVPYMDGTFDGRGHSITGVVLDDEISDYGLFRFIGQNGAVSRLTVEATVISDDEQENIGIIAGSNEGVITKCTAKGIVNAQSCVGGIVGLNEESGRISDCDNEAEIDGKFRTGGIAGYSKGDITGCVNSGKINTNAKVKKKDVNGDGDTVNISIPNAVTGIAADERANESGGIAGCSEGSILYCDNSGVIGLVDLGCITGGIVGRQIGSVQSCKNSGMVSGRKSVGGISGFVEPKSMTELDRDYMDEFTDELDDISDALDELDAAGEKLEDDLSGNVDDVREKVRDLKNVVRDYMDAYENDIESSRSVIDHNVDELEDIIDEMDYDFKLREINKAQKRLIKDITQMQEILEKLEAMSSGFSGDDYIELVQIIAAYKQNLSTLMETLEKLTQLLEKIKHGGASKPTVSQNMRGSAARRESWHDITDEDVKESDIEESVQDAVDEVSSHDGTDEDEGDEERSSARRPAAHAPSTVSESVIEAQAILKLLQELDDYSADANKQIRKISKYLSKWPGEVDDVVDDLRDISDELQDVYNAADDLFDKLHYRTDAFKGDVRWRTDGVGDAIEDTTDELEADWDKVADSLDNLRDHVDSVRTIFSDGYDEIKDRIKDKSRYVDVSMDVKLESGDGRVLFCENSGEVVGDSQAGGIVGAVDIESAVDTTVDIFEKYRHDDADKDEDEDEDEDDEKNSLTKHVSALIYGCKNTADVTGDSGYAGGVVGKAGYGAVTDCRSFCDVAAEDGKYAGGIAGYSKLAVLNSYFYGGVNASAYVGGVAGRGENIRSCYVCSYMDFDDPYIKAAGAIAGKAKGIVKDNYFVDNGYGAVDDVTKSGEAVCLGYDDFIRTVGEIDDADNVDTPQEFEIFTVKFVDGDEVVWSKDFRYGDVLPTSEYPVLEANDGEYVYWEYKEISPICRNVTVHSVRRVYIPSISGGDSEGRPDMILAGMFFPDSELTVRHGSETEWELLNAVKSDIAPDVHDVFTALYKYDVSQVEPFNGNVDMRVVSGLIPANTIVVLDGEMKPVTELTKCRKVGSYLSINAEIPSAGYVVVVEHVSKVTVALVIMIAAGIIILLAVINVLFFRWRKKKKDSHSIESAEEEEFAEDGPTDEEMAGVDDDEPDEYGPVDENIDDGDDFVDE